MKKATILLCLLVFVLSSGCITNDPNESQQLVKSGDYVTVDYTGRLVDGTVFDTSANRSPLGFTVGTGQVIKGFDDAVIGMAIGEEKVVTIPPEEAYGPCYAELVIDVPQDDFANANITPLIGQKITSSRFQGIITEISENNVTIDCNHHLAGETLEFTVKIVSIGSSNV